MSGKIADRVLYIHAGGPKTGSSAIQNFLSKNTSQLAAAGVSYQGAPEILRDREITSGNGESFYLALVANNSDSRIADLFQYYLGDYRAAICSFEGLIYLREEHWRRLINLAERLSIKLKIICYIRNVIPSYISSYDQLVKRHGIFCPIDEWACEFGNEWGYLGILKCLLSMKGYITYYVLSYEQHMHSLIGSFLSIINADLGIKITNKGHNPLINRSLTALEREILRTINASFGVEFSQELSDIFIYNHPDAKSAHLLSKETVTILKKRLSEDIAWVNTHFFHGKHVVRVTTHSPISNFAKNVAKSLMHPHRLIQKMLHYFRLQPHIEKSCHDQTIYSLLEWIVKKLEDAHQSNFNFMVSRLSQIDVENANHPSIPDNFDPVAYLLSNQDVLRAGVNPYIHYIQHGQYENREWKWPNLLEKTDDVSMEIEPISSYIAD